MLGPGGQEVPYQLLSSGRIAVRTDLAANATRTWQLMSGRAPQPAAGAVTLTTGPGYYEVLNGLTGVRVFNPTGMESTTLAPIQGIQLRDGRWTATGPNKLYVASHGDVDNQPLSATNIVARVIENGPLKVAIQMTQEYARPETALGYPATVVAADLVTETVRVASGHLFDRDYVEGLPVKFFVSGSGQLPAPLQAGTIYYASPSDTDAFQLRQTPGGPVIDLSGPMTGPSNTITMTGVIPAGRGYYTSTIELQAGQPSIMIEDDTDLDFRYFLSTYGQVQATRARYRGHHSTSVANGYEADGRQYRPAHERPPMDAFRNLQYSTPALWNPYWGIPNSFPTMSPWNPWSVDTGWYWMLYNQNAGNAAPVIGAFVGRASRAIGCHATGPSPFTAPAGAAVLPPELRTGIQSGLMFETRRISGDARVFPRSRMSWGIFVGTKGADLADPLQYQNIARQMSLHGGINLNKVKDYQLSFADPPAGYGRLYMEPGILQGMVARLRAETSRGLNQYSGPYYSYLYNAEPSARPVIDIWADATGAKLSPVVSNLVSLAASALDAYVNRDGVFDWSYQYWNGSSQMSRQLPFIDAVLMDDNAAPAQRDAVKAVAALFANLLWDNDLAPLENATSSGVSMGSPSMPVEHAQYRNAYTLFLSAHPIMQPKVPAVKDQIVDIFQNIVNDQGAAMSSPHYQGASVTPTVAALLQLRMSGLDVFGTEPRLRRFAEFYLNLLTPSEVRFGGSRKLFAAGDGSTEGTELTGMLATGFRMADPGLSARLMGAWTKGGKVHRGDAGSSLLMIDESAPAVDPGLATSHYPGYCSVLRHGVGTPDETALWLLNGDFYRDHRNDDRGSLTLYALGAPVAVSWGSFYSPQAWGGNMKNMILTLTDFPSWNQNNQALDLTSKWVSSANDLYASFRDSAISDARMSHASGLTWRRIVRSIHPSPSLTLVSIRDEFAGQNPSQAKILTLNLMADGAVQTPAGNVTPPRRTYDGSAASQPSASAAFNLTPGLSRFRFQGQEWNAHPTRGADWDVYELSAEPLSANLGNWAHTWAPSREQSEFQAANGRSFEERQHILRVKGSGTFRTFILPFRKGERPSDLQVTAADTQLVVRTGDQILLVDDHSYTYTNLQKRVLTTFSTNSASAFGFTLSGGPTELVLENNRAYVTSHGGHARRVLSGPPDWTVARVAGQILPATVPINPLNIDYTADQPQTVVLE